MEHSYHSELAWSCSTPTKPSSPGRLVHRMLKYGTLRSRGCAILRTKKPPPTSPFAHKEGSPTRPTTHTTRSLGIREQRSGDRKAAPKGPHGSLTSVLEKAHFPVYCAFPRGNQPSPQFTSGRRAVMISPSALERFRANLRGSLLQPGEASYDEARKVWNGMIDRRRLIPTNRVM